MLILKKGLAAILAVLLCMSALTVTSLSAFAQEVDVVDEAAYADVRSEGTDVEIVEEGSDSDIAEEGAEIDLVPEAADREISGEGAVVQHYDIKTLGERLLNLNLNVGDSVTISFKEESYSGDLKIKSYTRSTLGEHDIISVTSKNDESIWWWPGGIGPKTFTITALKPGKCQFWIEAPCYNMKTDKEEMYYVHAYITVTGSSSTNLSTPKITNFSSTDDGVKVTWGAVSGAEKYRLFYKNGKGNWVKIGDTTSTSLTDTVVSSGSTYTYTVRCLNSNATKYTSGYDSSGWRYTYNMATPKITGMSSSSAGVKITWGAVPNAKKYSVFYKGRNGWVKMANTTATSYTDSDVRYGATYTYTVRCIKSDGSRYTSSYDSSGWKHTHTKTLATPRISSSDVVSNGIKLYWGAVSGADKYRVFYKGKTGWKKLLDTTATSCIDTDVRYDKTYTYTVRCLSADGKNYTSSYDAAGRKVTYCSPPEIVEVGWDNSDDTLFVDISCEHYELMDYYKVWYKTSSGWTYLGSTTTGWILEPKAKLKVGSTYAFTARGYDDDGNAMSYFDTSGFREYVWEY